MREIVGWLCAWFFVCAVVADIKWWRANLREWKLANREGLGLSDYRRLLSLKPGGSIVCYSRQMLVAAQKRGLKTYQPDFFPSRWDWYIEFASPTGFIVALLTFLGSWIYCVANYGFLLGLGLGWLPSFFVAILAFGIWFLLWIPALFLVLYIVAYAITLDPVGAAVVLLVILLWVGCRAYRG